MSGARHYQITRGENTEREEAEKQQRLEVLGANFRTYVAGRQGARLPCALCACYTLGRVALTATRYISLCPEHDAWDVAALVYVEDIDDRSALNAAYDARRARTSG